ncbi:MAG TPA: hypothetical protein VF695_08000 [Sphingomonas sp.]|jgi:hypothetical protein
MTDARIDHYDWSGGREAMLRFGPADGPIVVIALPLFEEANRTRAFAVSILRALADRGIAGVLPDMPGQGESLIATRTATLFMMKEAYEALVERVGAGRCYGIGLRSGALLDAFAPLRGRWYLTPQSGNELLRDILRLLAAAGRKTDRWGLFGSEDPVEVAGNLVSPALLTALADAEPFDEPGVPRRIVRLTTDTSPADRQVEGSPLWRRAEPGNDMALVQLLAEDIVDWVRACEA